MYRYTYSLESGLNVRSITVPPKSSLQNHSPCVKIRRFSRPWKSWDLCPHLPKACHWQIIFSSGCFCLAACKRKTESTTRATDAYQTTSGTEIYHPNRQHCKGTIVHWSLISLRFWLDSFRSWLLLFCPVCFVSSTCTSMYGQGQRDNTRWWFCMVTFMSWCIF